eukprot:gene50360-67443_t
MTRFDDIQLLRINYLRGPNLWTYRPVLEVWLDLGQLEDYPSNKIDGFTDRLTGLLPALIEHHCGVGERGGFIQRLTEGTWSGHVLEHVVIELLNLAGMPTGFGQTRSTSEHGVYRMVFRARDESVARVALAQGHALIMAAINDQPFDVAAAVARGGQGSEPLAMVGVMKPSLHYYSRQVVFYEGAGPLGLINLNDRLAKEHRPGLSPSPAPRDATPDPISKSTVLVVIDQGTAQQAGWQTLPHQELASHGIYRLWRVERWQLARRAGQLVAVSAIRPDWQKPRPERY